MIRVLYVMIHGCIFYRSNDLRVPKKEWMELPAMAFECQLYNIGFGSNDINLLAGKLDEIYNKVVVARVMVFSSFVLFSFFFKKFIFAKLVQRNILI